MSYQNHRAYSNGLPPPQYPGPHYNNFVDHHHTNQGGFNGYPAYDTNAFGANGNYTSSGPSHQISNGIQQHPQVSQTYHQSLPRQQPYTPPQVQQAPQLQQQYNQPTQQHLQHSPLPHQQQYLSPQPSQQRGFAVAIPIAPPPPPTDTPNNGFVHMSEIQEQTIPKPALLDYQTLLLSLADEYLTAAYELGAIAETIENNSQTQEYYRLITAGLGCLDALLKRCKLAPEKEAKVRLQYATILYEETENTMEAEEALSKGISVCDRYKYFDLKYNMQHLLARVTFTKNAKAAFKFLEQAIADASAYQHTAWEYAFRFLKVSLHLKVFSSHDISAAHVQLRIIASVAPNHGDKAILAMASMMEAMVYLKEPGESGGFEQAQRCLASVRSLQLDPEIANIPQLAAFISFVDLACHLQRFYPDPAFTATQNMQGALAQLVGGDNDNSEGFIALPVSKGSMPPSTTETGVVRQKSKDGLVLMFNWMPNEDIYNVGYIMSGLALVPQNTMDGHRSEQMFSQGLQRRKWAQESSDKVAKSIILFVWQMSWRERMAYYMHLYSAFILASRTAYTDAKAQVDRAKRLHSSWPDIPHDLLLMTRYLKGAISQGTGDLHVAFSTFQNIAHEICPTNQYASGLPSQTHIRNVAQLDRELYILSTMNILQIIRNPDHPAHPQFDELLARIAPHCTHSSNRGITAAYHVINAACPASSSILPTKQALNWGLGHAQAVKNNQLVCVILNILSWKFFEGILVEQTEKSAQAGLKVAKSCADTLWISVSAGVKSASLEAAGRLQEAAQVQAEAKRYARDLPPKIQEIMSVRSA